VGARIPGHANQGLWVDAAKALVIRITRGYDGDLRVVILAGVRDRLHDEQRLLIAAHAMEARLDVAGAAGSRPSAARAAVPGLNGKSPSVAENVPSYSCSERTTSRIIQGKLAPREPSAMFLMSMISAPPLATARASSKEMGLINTFMGPWFLRAGPVGSMVYRCELCVLGLFQ